MSSLHKLYVGIDSHSQTHKVAIIPVENLQGSLKDLKKSKVIDIGNNINDFKRLKRNIHKYTSSIEEIVIGIDSCGIYTLPLTFYLQNQQYQLCFIENKLSKATRGYIFDLENKRDDIDAIRVAHLLYLKDLAGSLFRTTTLKLPDLSSKASILHTLTLHRQQYNKLITQSTNRLHVFLIGVFPEAESKYFTRLLKILPYYSTPQEIARSRGMKKVKGVGENTKNEIKELAKKTVGIPGSNYRVLIQHLCQQREQAMAWKSEIDELLKKEVTEHPYGPILLSFPCFGVSAAATIIGIIGDMERWANDKKLKKALGVYSSFRASGKMLSVQKQGKSGNRLGKSTLYQVTMRCLPNTAPENDFRDYYQRRVLKGKRKISAIIATMGKMVELIYHCLKTGEPYRYQCIYKKYRKTVKKSLLFLPDQQHLGLESNKI
jgi:transposase